LKGVIFVFSQGAQRFILEFFRHEKGHYWSVKILALEKEDFTFNGSQFARVVRELMPEWIEIVEHKGRKGYMLTRDGLDLGRNIYRRWQRVNGTG